VTSPARPDGQVVELVQGPADFVRYADQLGLDVERFNHHLRKHAGAQRIAEDVEGADLSGVSGTPTFFTTGAATSAPTTSPPSRPPSVGPAPGGLAAS
jgi:hypothetical protein